MPIAGYLKQDKDVDILAAFRALPSPAAKLSSLERVVDLHQSAVSPLLQYRCLITLARAVAEPGFDISSREGAIARLFERTRANRPASHPDPAERSPTFDPANLSAALRTMAAGQLRHLIELKLTVPRICYSARTAKPVSLALFPARLDLGMGGISDIPPYCLERSGTCVNAPILLGGEFPIAAEAKVIREPVLRLVSKDLAVESVVRDWPELDCQPDALRFHCAVLSYFRNCVPGFEDFRAIPEHLKGGLQIETMSRLPPGTGLGVSSLLSCAVVKAIGGILGVNLTSPKLVSISAYLEYLSGVGGGWEDATATLPGIKLLETSRKRPFSPRVTRVRLGVDLLRRLERHLLLVNTGIQRKNTSFLVDMVERYCLRDPVVLRRMDRITGLNRWLPEALSAGDLVSVGQTIRSQWENWRACSEDQCTGAEINELFSRLEPFAYGMRMNGIGQGGCAMILLRDEKARASAEEIIRRVLGPSATCYRWQVVPSRFHGTLSSSIP